MRHKKVKTPEEIYKEVLMWGFCGGCDECIPLVYLKSRDGALKCKICILQKETNPHKTEGC